MDLKGSLVDTKLKIYPSDILKQFLKNVAGDDIPINILKFTKNKDRMPTKSEIKCEYFNPVQLNDKDYENLNKIKNIVKKFESVRSPGEELDNLTKTKFDDKDEKKTSKPSLENTSENGTEEGELEARDGLYLLTSDLDWLFSHLQKRRTNSDIPNLHVLLEGSYIETPQNKVLKRNPVLEARCVKLRVQQEAREYRQMTKSVDNVRMRFPEDSISYQCKYL